MRDMSVYKQKISWSATKRLVKTFSTKPDVKIPFRKPGEATETVETNMEGPVRYNVCQERNSSTFKFEKPEIPPKISMGFQDLQPSTHPQFYSKELENERGKRDPEEQGKVPKANSEETAVTSRHRTFIASTTYKNVTLPLKLSKLANPFPDPVKVMSSQTVSDQEKAEQMLAESRVQDFYRRSH